MLWTGTCGSMVLACQPTHHSESVVTTLFTVRMKMFADDSKLRCELVISIFEGFKFHDDSKIGFHRSFFLRKSVKV